MPIYESLEIRERIEGNPDGRRVALLDSLGLTLASTRAPATATSPGTAGMIAWDTGFIYVCTSANSWKRVAIAAW